MAKKPNTETQDEYRHRIMDTVCALMAEGQSLRRICRSVNGMPKHSTVLSWVAEDKGLADQYTRAINSSADYGFDALQDLPTEIVQKYLKEGWEPKDAIQIAKLEVDKEKWRLAKMVPKKYGDKMTLAGDSENPLQGMTDEQLLARLDQLRK